MEHTTMLRLVPLVRQYREWTDDRGRLADQEEQATPPPDPDDWAESDDEAAELLHQIGQVLLDDRDVRIAVGKNV